MSRPEDSLSFRSAFKGSPWEGSPRQFYQEVFSNFDTEENSKHSQAQSKQSISAVKTHQQLVQNRLSIYLTCETGKNKNNRNAQDSKHVRLEQQGDTTGLIKNSGKKQKTSESPSKSYFSQQANSGSPNARPIRVQNSNHSTLKRKKTKTEKAKQLKPKEAIQTPMIIGLLDTQDVDSPLQKIPFKSLSQLNRISQQSLAQKSIRVNSSNNAHFSSTIDEEQQKIIGKNLPQNSDCNSRTIQQINRITTMEISNTTSDHEPSSTQQKQKVDSEIYDVIKVLVDDATSFQQKNSSHQNDAITLKLKTDDSKFADDEVSPLFKNSVSFYKGQQIDKPSPVVHNKTQARRSSIGQTQKFQPRSSQTTKNEVYLVSPQNFNKLIFPDANEKKKETSYAFCKGFRGRPSQDVENRSKREIMRRMAGLYSNKPPPSPQSELDDQTVILPEPIVRPLSPEQSLYCELPSTPTESQQNYPTTKITVWPTVNRKPYSKRCSIHGGESTRSGEETLTFSGHNRKNIVHNLQGERSLQQTNATAEPTNLNYNSIMSEDCINHLPSETIEQIPQHLLDDFMIQRSHENQNFGRILSQGDAHKDTAHQGQIQIVNKNSKLDHTSLSIQPSSHLDNEYSLDNNRLTPKEIQMNSVKNDFLLSSYNSTQHQTTPKLSKIKNHTKIKRNHKSRDIGKKLPSSKLTVRIRKTHKKKDQSTAMSARIQEIEDPRVLEQQHKTFIRQVYTNMQKSYQYNPHYDKIKRSLLLDFQNGYKRRRQSSQNKNSNEWQFGLMQSRLKSRASKTIDYKSEIGVAEKQTEVLNQADTSSGFDFKNSSIINNDESRLETPQDLVHDYMPICNTKHKSTSQNSTMRRFSEPEIDLGGLTDQQVRISMRGTENYNTGMSIISNPIDDSIGESCISFNPHLKKSSVGHDQSNKIYQDCTRLLPSSLYKTVVQNDTKAQQGKGPNAYLDFMQARLKIKSQGHNTRPRPRHLTNNIKDIKSMLQDSKNSITGFQTSEKYDSSQAKVFLSMRSQMRSSDTQRIHIKQPPNTSQQNQSLQPSADAGVSTCDNFSNIRFVDKTILNQDKTILNQKGLRTTKHSLTGIEKYHQSIREQQFLTPRPHLTSTPIKSIYSEMQGQPHQIINTNYHPATPTSNIVNPALFKPIELKVLEVDSLVKATSVAKAISKNLSPSIVQHLPQKGFQKRKNSMQRTFSIDQKAITSATTRHTQQLKACHQQMQQFNQAIDLNRIVSEQNRALRRKAFSFSKTVVMGDICKMAKNLDDLSKNNIQGVQRTENY